MLTTVSQRFQGCCMMVMRQSGEAVTFLASGFLVDRRGYLLTAARAVPHDAGLVAVPPQVDETFAPVAQKEVSPVPVEVVSRDVDHDAALLKLKPELPITMPDQILGIADRDPRGSALLSLGVPFGYYRIHGVVVTQAILSGRVQSHSGTRLIIFDRRVQYGDIGGPLISVTDGQVIGIVGGVFDPMELDGPEPPKDVLPINSDLSYAMSIEYGKKLLDQALGA